jgi:hypothetical protein
MELDRFLWAELQIRMLCRLKLMSPAQIDDELDKPPAALASTYEAIYAMINAEPDKDDRSQRNSYDPTSFNADYLRRVCHNLVSIDRKRNVVQLIHLSVREFHEKKVAFSEIAPDAMATETCLSSYAALCRKA